MHMHIFKCMLTGEDFCDASMREVWEETGVKCQFQSILAFRHSHAQQFGRSNLYVICLLEASQEAIRVDAEIEAAQWMELEEFRNSTEHPMSQLIVDLVTEHRNHQSMTDIHSSISSDCGNSSGGGVVETEGKKREFLGMKEKNLSSVLHGPLPYKFYHV